MAKAHKKKAATHARTARWPNRAEAQDSEELICDDVAAVTNPDPEWAPENDIVTAEHWDPIYIDSESDTDCDYNGGVNCRPDSDDENDRDCSDDWSDSEEGSLVEFEDDDLGGLRAELNDLGVTLPYDHVMENKSAKDWRKVESNRALGYTGTSKCTQQRRAKEARDRAEFHGEAKTLSE